jgi:hypothetical protein
LDVDLWLNGKRLPVPPPQINKIWSWPNVILARGKNTLRAVGHATPNHKAKKKDKKTVTDSIRF